MWIRSQDKKELIDVSDRRLFAEDGSIFIDLLLSSIDEQGEIELGYYKTAEKSVKVLDYIQNAIVQGKEVYLMPEN